MRKIVIVIIVLCVIALICASILTFEKEKIDAGTSEFCSAGSGCSSVQTSAYAYFYGVPVSALGMFAFISLIALYIFYEKTKHRDVLWLIDIGVILGLMSVIRFLYVMKFILNAWCFYCIVVDVSMVLIGIIHFWARFTKRLG